MRLKILGEVETPLELSAEDLARFPESDKIDDVRRIGARRQGGGVYLRALVERARPASGVRYVTFRSPSDDFMASVPLERVRGVGVVIFALDGAPMTRREGGPFRFIIPDPAACGGDEIDECVNVKFLEEILLTAEPGRDTRPQDEIAHRRLHGG